MCGNGDIGVCNNVGQCQGHIAVFHLCCDVNGLAEIGVIEKETEITDFCEMGNVLVECGDVRCGEVMM